MHWSKVVPAKKKKEEENDRQSIIRLKEDWEDEENHKKSVIKNVIAPAETEKSTSILTILKNRGSLETDDGSNKGARLSEISSESCLKPILLAEIANKLFKIVEVPYMNEMNKSPDVQFSNSMVIRSIGRNSNLLPSLIVGDQVLEVNDQPILTAKDFFSQITKKEEGYVRVIRVWNNTHCGDRLPARRIKDLNYLIVEFHKFPELRNGFEISQKNRYYEVINLKKGQRGHHTFLLRDHIIDIDGTQVAQISDMETFRKKFNELLKRRLMCSFVVERQLTLNSTPNSSLQALRALEKNQEVEMGDDSAEIGAREAVRFLAMTDKYQPQSIKSDEQSITLTDLDNGEKIKRTKRSARYEWKVDKTSKIPSDVKDASKLQKVTPRSGIIDFVRSYWKNEKN